MENMPDHMENMPDHYGVLNTFTEVEENLNGWMVTYGPLSMSGEMALREAMSIVDRGIEEFTQYVDEVKSHVDDVEENTPESFAQLKEDFSELEDENKRYEKSENRMKRRIEKLETLLKDQEELTEGKTKIIKMLQAEMSREKMSDSW